MKNENLSSIDSLSEDLNLINSIKNGDSDAIKLLIDKHSGVCVNTYKRYINLPSLCGFISDEIISSKDYIIYNSARSYNPTMGSKFSTWLSNQTRYFCLNCINKYNKLVPVPEQDLIHLIESEGKKNKQSILEKEIKNETIEIAKETLSELKNKKIQECIIRKYFSKEDKSKTFTDVAQEMNVTVQTVINWHKKFIKLIRQKCKNRKITFDFQ
jgi:hypothetical protein